MEVPIGVVIVLLLVVLVGVYHFIFTDRVVANAPVAPAPVTPIPATPVPVISTPTQNDLVSLQSEPDSHINANPATDDSGIRTTLVASDDVQPMPADMSADARSI